MTQYKINSGAQNKNTISIAELKEQIKQEAFRHLKHIKDSRSHAAFNLAFLKATIYIEEILKDVNFHFDKNLKDKPLGNQINAIKKYINLEQETEEDQKIYESAFEKLDFINEIRKKIAHDLEYNLINDKNALNSMRITILDSEEEKAKKVALYFKGIIFPFLHFKLGIKNFDNFLIPLEHESN
ncbi:MAG: hypothetical protein RL150_375 [Candidatus Parcubacteria bacterium]|jgi:ATP-dependent Lon protease